MNTHPNSRPIEQNILRTLPHVAQTNATVAPAAGKSAAPRKKSSQGGLVASILAGAVICLALLVVTVVFSSAPAMASMLRTEPQAASTLPPHSAQSDLRMPTFTPSPTATPESATPSAAATLPPSTATDSNPTLPPDTSSPTETPAVLEMSVLADTPTPEVSVASQPAASGADVSTSGKYILVDISQQHMYVYQDGALLWSFVASTGMNNATRTGLFHVQDKIPNAYGSTWNIWMPNWLGIYYAGGLENGIHALPILPSGARLWAGWLGTPISYGCVVLGVDESQMLYNWADVGTPVEIQW